MKTHNHIPNCGGYIVAFLAVALWAALLVPIAVADDGNCGNGQGTGNGCLPQAPAALAGPQGPAGPIGPVGPQGPKGDTGAVGPQGLKGDTGAVGPQGPAGPQGLKGDTGAVGPQGPAGPQGLKGETGTVGLQGPAGPQGLKGETGAVGPQGPAGSRGEAGLQGLAGPAGPVGPQGPQGVAGTMGPQGPKGEKGEQGERGLPGGFTAVSQVQTGVERAIDTPRVIPGGSLTALVPVVQQNITSGDFVLNANIDLAPTLPIAQQYTCQLKVADQIDPVDALPIIYGAQTRLHLSGAVHINTPAQVTVNCGTDAPASLLKARLIVLRIDRITSAMAGSN